MLNTKDLEQIKSKGISQNEIERQIENFRNGFPFVKLVAPATKDNGIIVFGKNEAIALSNYFNDEIKNHKVLKFVPASGAASRMFRHLFEFMQSYKGAEEDYKKFTDDKSFNSVYNFFSEIRNFAFIDDLKEALLKNGYDFEKLLSEKKYVKIIEYLLTEKGLGYAKRPKGLLKFHQYENYSRFSIEEHLVEGAVYSKNNEDKVYIHFTVSPEHKKKFKTTIEQVKGRYEKYFGVEYQISYSIQKPSTDTIAVDMQNEPFREDDGRILFRPGGHGALIENLNDLNGEIIFIKNIDNIIPDRLKEQTYLYKKVIGGLLLKLQSKSNEYLIRLENGNPDEEELKQIANFAVKDLFIKIDEGYGKMDRKEKTDYLFNKMNRPIRICGMVKNEGEPGGGPFWLRNEQGDVSLQIVESSQIDLNNSEQSQKVTEATHFNPVDLVCSVKDYKGKSFDLKQYIDTTTGFISIKSKDGRKLKAQELPGLWNGAMANWITIFVETPIITFNPVKTINDLLRKEHRKK